MTVTELSAPAERVAQRRAARPAGPSRRGSRRRDWPWAYAMIAPTGLGLAVFYLWPLARTVYFSFTEWGAFGGYAFSGLDNYRRLLDDPELLAALRNTFLYAALVLLVVPLSILVAALLNTRGLRGVGVYRTLYFLPVVTMPAAVAMLWRWIYSGDYGVLNYLLSLVGIDGPYWVSDPAWLLCSMAAVGIWMLLGYNTVIFVAGLQGIPEHYYEAAAIDGAGRVRQFFSVTLPLLSPSIFFVTVITTITTLQMFDLLYLMTSKVSLARTENQTVVYLFYKQAFIENERGYAAAIAVVLLLIVLTLTALQFRMQKRWVHYE